MKTSFGKRDKTSDQLIMSHESSDAETDGTEQNDHQT